MMNTGTDSIVAVKHGAQEFGLDEQESNKVVNYYYYLTIHSASGLAVGDHAQVISSSGEPAAR